MKAMYKQLKLDNTPIKPFRHLIDSKLRNEWFYLIDGQWVITAQLAPHIRGKLLYGL